WEEGTNAPTVEEVNKLIDVLDLKEDKAFQAEREKIGEVNTNLTAYQNIGGKNESGKINITAPATDLAKHWDGFKVGGIKPAYEPIVWAVKPPEGSYIDNVLKWGVGAVNVDECRVVGDYKCDGGTPGFTADKGWHPNSMVKLGERQTQGRFPANVILSHHPECEQVGVKRVRGGTAIRKNVGISERGNIGTVFAAKNRGKEPDVGFTGPNGYETVESWNCHPDCPIKMLDEMSGEVRQGNAGQQANASSIFGSNSNRNKRTVF
ncbi:unnamed protein product, partial [marine sediment metagenome]